MATCHNCGAELNGQYCNTCGARAQDDRAPRKTHKEAPKAAKATTATRPGGVLPSTRVARTTAMGLLAVALFGAGTVFGFWLAGSNGSAATAGGLTSTAGDEGELPMIAVAGKYMDEGVDYLNKGERTAATQSFRKAIDAYEKLLKSDPNDLYARTYLGLTYYYVGDSKKALEAEQTVLKQDPNYLWAIFNLAWIYETAGKNTEALGMYQKYLAVAPTEKENTIKYAEQFELIDRQLDTAKQAVDKLKGGAGK